MARILTDKQRDEFMEIFGSPFHADVTSLMKAFAYTKKAGKVRFYPDDIITIGPEHSPYVKNNAKTTCGCYVFNKVVIEELEIFGYLNVELTAKMVKKIQAQMDIAMQEGDLTPEKRAGFIDHYQWLFGGPLSHVINPSLSSTILSLPNSAKQLRTKMFKEYAAELDAGDPEISAKIENAVVSAALEEMRKTDDPSVAIYDAGTGVDPYNNYRSMFVMKGAIQDNTGECPSGYKIVKSNYNEGITKEDVPIIADSLVRSSYMRGVVTQDSGFDTKVYNTANQHVRLQPRGSFCGTTQTVPIQITEQNKEKYVYRYIKTSAKNPVMLTYDTIDSYVGKEVQMYSPLRCKAKDPEYCNICAGDRPYLINLRNVGLTFSVISGATMNNALKAMHKTKVELYTITVDDIVKHMNHPIK